MQSAMLCCNVRMIDSIKYCISVVLVLIVLFSCEEEKSIGLRTKPSMHDLIGTYNISDNCRKWIAQNGFDRDSSIILLDNGIIRLNNMPIISMQSGRFGGFVTGAGAWRISDVAIVKSSKIWGICFKLNGAIVKDGPMSNKYVEINDHVSILGQQPPYILNYFMNDPDFALDLEFIKSE